MVGTVIASAALLLYLAVAFALFRFLAVRVSRRAIGPFNAGALYWVVLAAVPWLLTWIGFRLGWHIYLSYPSVREASWDVALALTVYIGMVSSYVIGLVSACVASWRFAVRGRGGSVASAT